MECPKCGSSQMWDNRTTKTNPRAPDWKCKTRGCDGAVWPPKDGGQGNAAPHPSAPVQQAPAARQPVFSGPRVPEIDGPEAELPARFAIAFASYDICLEHAIAAAAKYPTASLDISAIAATLFINAAR